MVVDISLGIVSKSPVAAFFNVFSELWRQPGIQLSMAKDDYATTSLDLANAPVLGGSVDSPFTYALFVDPVLADGRFTVDWRQYELAIATSPISDTQLSAVFARNLTGDDTQNSYQIQSLFAPGKMVSLSGSLGFSETQLTVYEGTFIANRMTGSRSGDLMNGNNGDDVIIGGHGKDVLQGGNDNDKLSGGKGIDKLIGGAGNDTLNGGNGNDWLTGGSGEDKFILSKGHDTITDYINDEGDVIRINSKTFTSFELAQDGADVVLTAIISPDRDAKLTILNATANEIAIEIFPDL